MLYMFRTLFASIIRSAADDGRKGRPKHVEHTCSF